MPCCMWFQSMFSLADTHAPHFDGCRLQFLGTKSTLSMSSSNTDGSIGGDRCISQAWCSEGGCFCPEASQSCWRTGEVSVESREKSTITQNVAETRGVCKDPAVNIFFARIVSGRNTLEHLVPTVAIQIIYQWQKHARGLMKF